MSVRLRPTCPDPFASPFGNLRGLRIQQQPRRFAGARRHHHGAAADLLLGARGLIDVRNRRHLARRRPTISSRAIAPVMMVSLPGLHRREDHRLARRERRSRAAAAPALPAVVAGGAAVDRLRQHRHARRNAPECSASCPARWISISCTRGAIGGRNLPSGAVRIPSCVPVTPMNSSALSYQGDISS